MEDMEKKMAEIETVSSTGDPTRPGRSAYNGVDAEKACRGVGTLVNQVVWVKVHLHDEFVEEL